jgi:hypothetical protein
MMESDDGGCDPGDRPGIAPTDAVPAARPTPTRSDLPAMSAEDLENYETEMELQLYREYRDVVGLFSYVVETERRFYLANQVDLQVRSAGGEVFFEVTLSDAWVWDVYRPARFVKSVRVVTFKDVNVEELAKSDLELPKSGGFSGT